MAFFLSPIGNGQQYLSVASQLATAVGGTFNTYLAGTSTPYATLTSSSGASNNPISIAIGANGTLPNPVWIAGGVAIKIIILDALSNAIGPTYDNISGVGDFNAPGNPNAANSISYTAPFTGAVTTTVGAKLSGDWVSVKDFGALGNGSHDDTVAIQAACNTGSSLVFFPNGTYVISSTILPNAHQILLGSSDSVGSPTSIQAATGMNVPMFKFTAAGKLSWMSIVGSSTGLTTNQFCVYITGCNNVTLDACLMSGGYDLVHIDGAGAAFYLNFFDCIFYACKNAQFYVNCSNASGVDMIMRSCRFLTGGGTYCVYMNGLGSLLWTDVQMSAAPSSNGCLYLDNPASLFGGAQFTNCVFENDPTSGGAAAVYVHGNLTPWQQMKFVNCFLVGINQIALRSDFCNGLYFTQCVISSTNASGAVFFPNAATTADFTFTDCDFEGTAAVTPVQCGGALSILNGSFVSCRWNGTNPMVDFSNSNNVTLLNVYGGRPGTNATPIKLNTDISVPGARIYSGIAGGTQGNWQAYTPVVTWGGGAPGAGFSATGFYQKIGRTYIGQFIVALPNVGTVSQPMTVTLPQTAAAGTIIVANGGDTVTGKALQARGTAGSGTVAVFNYDNTFPGSVPCNVTICFTYNGQQ